MTADTANLLPAPAEIEAFLRTHPDFLAERPDLLRAMTPPSRYTESGDPIADFQSAMIRGLRLDVERLSRTSVDLVATSQGNLSRQQRTHSAALSLAAAATPADFHRVLIRDWPPILDVDAVALVLEDAGSVSVEEGPEGILRVPAGTVDALFREAPEARILLTAERRGGNRLFGTPGARVRSDALCRLNEPATWEPGDRRAAPVGLLAVGAFETGAFHPDQATDLLEFLARLLAIVLGRWCAPTP